jgi:predicted MFS family arabinose efflux permease
MAQHGAGLGPVGGVSLFFMSRFRSRPLASLYVAGPFAMGYTEFYNFLIPLDGLSLGMNASAIGTLVGGRSLLAVFLSIHVGVLMDRFGTRRVTLFFVWAAMALAPVFPLLPWFWPLLLLQIVNGGALQFAWSGSQTLIAQLSEGEAEYLGRFRAFPSPARATDDAALPLGSSPSGRAPDPG